MALRGAPLATIMHGLNQSNYHIRALNLGGTPGGLRLTELTARARKSADSQWDLPRRDAFASAVDEVLDDLGFLIEANQPDFQRDLQEMTTSAQRIAARGASA